MSRVLGLHHYWPLLPVIGTWCHGGWSGLGSRCVQVCENYVPLCLHKTGNGSCLLKSKAVRLDSKRAEIRGCSTIPEYSKKIVQP